MFCKHLSSEIWFRRQHPLETWNRASEAPVGIKQSTALTLLSQYRSLAAGTRLGSTPLRAAGSDARHEAGAISTCRGIPLPTVGGSHPWKPANAMPRQAWSHNHLRKILRNIFWNTHVRRGIFLECCRRGVNTNMRRTCCVGDMTQFERMAHFRSPETERKDVIKF